MPGYPDLKIKTLYQQTVFAFFKIDLACNRKRSGSSAKRS